MANIRGGTTLALLDVDAYKKGARVSVVPRAAAHTVSSITGTIGAALAVDSAVFAMRLDPAAGAGYKAFITAIRVQWVTIVAFTTPVTAARRLALFRGSGAAASGGTALTPVRKDLGDAVSQVASGEGGDVRIATTGALTVTGITFEANPLRTLTLTHVGAAGNFVEDIWEIGPVDGAPIVLAPGELIAVRNPVAMDAAGTWQLAVTVDWYEGTV